jgi:uncharacterized membrane protein
MTVDVIVETVIGRPIIDVATYAGDPTHAPEWYANIRSVDWKTPPPLARGSQLAFVATFLGRTLSYTYEIVELERGERLTMRTAEGPFPMETTYVWTPLGPAKTRMTLRNVGAPRGFAKIATLLLATSMRRAMSKDLQALKRRLEEPERE